MSTSSRLALGVLSLLTMLTGVTMTSGVGAQGGRDWPQFGGPQRNFVVNTPPIPAAWPAGGPKQLWKRELGEGFSPLAVAGDMLYTMHQRKDFEVVVALDADTGMTIWQHGYMAPITASMSRAPGPRATPLVIEDAVYTVGATGKLHRLHRHDGTVDWTHDLFAAFKAQVQDEYYAASPLAYRNTIIVPVGGPGAGVVAFDQKNGKVVWKSLDKRISYASPILIDVDGQPQVVVVMESEVVGIDPANGALLWEHPHANRTKTNVSSPLWTEGNLLFVSSAYDSGGRVLKLTRRDNKTTVEELWFSRDLRIHVANAVRIGDVLYGSSGDFGPAFFSAVEVKTGKTLWQQRDVVKSSILLADGKFVMLNEDGELLLASPGDNGLNVLARAPVLSKTSYTPPSLVGTRLYLRDRTHAVALDLAPR